MIEAHLFHIREHDVALPGRSDGLLLRLVLHRNFAKKLGAMLHRLVIQALDDGGKLAELGLFPAKEGGKGFARSCFTK